MNNLIEYKGYHAKIEFSAEDELFVGRVLGINDVLMFDGETVSEIKETFIECIDDYLEMCAEEGLEPDKEYKGSFNVRISPELHKLSALESERRSVSLNQFVADAIKNELDGNHEHNSETIVWVMPERASELFSGFASKKADSGNEYLEESEAVFSCTKNIKLLTTAS